MFNPTERQQDFLNAIFRDQKKFVLYGGAAGGGKSYILRWANIAHLLNLARQGHPHVRVGLFCEDFPALRERHLAKIRLEVPQWLGRYRDSVHELQLDDRYGGGIIAFRNLDDVSKYLSAEFAAISIDELTRNPMDVFDFLRMRLRWPDIEYTPFMAGTNPGGIGHSWVKQIWIDRDIPPDLLKYYSPDDFHFIPAKAQDNPHLTESYYISLKSLPENLRKAYAEGSWDVFEGQVFTEWRPDVHVCEPFEIPSNWPRYRSLDWGFTKPYAVYWHAIDYNGVIWTYRELYGSMGSPDTGSQETAEKVAKMILKLEKDEKIFYGVADTNIWERKGTSQGKTIADNFAENGVFWNKAIKGPNSRIQGKMQMHNRLRGWNYGTEEWKPAWKVFSTCKNLIRTLPSLTYDERRVEDVNTRQEDHAYDSIRYFFIERPFVPVMPAPGKRIDAYDEVEKPSSTGGYMSA
jgi:hypothetical protein